MSEERKARSPLLTPAEVAERLGVHRRTVYLWLRSGKLPGLKVGSQWRIPKEQAAAVLRDYLHWLRFALALPFMPW